MGKFSLAIFHFSPIFILFGEQTIPLENISFLSFRFFTFLFCFQSHFQILNI